MKKYSKKVLLALSLIMILSTSIGYAQGRHNGYNNNYSNRYSNNRFNRYLSNNYHWSWNYRWNTSKVEEKPVVKDQVTEEKPVIEQEPETHIAPSNSIEMEVVRLVNIERQKAGLASLNHSSQLSNVARAKSEDMGRNNYFSHNSPTYGDPFSMMRSFGINYTTAGENIAQGYYTAESVVRGWMNSPGHRENILNPSFGTIGVGYSDINGTTYWTQMFTN